MAKPFRLQKYLTSKELIELLPISRPTYYKFLSAGRFEGLIKRDPISRFHYAEPSDLPKIIAAIQV